jgi:CRP-like cAMP-binding protein
MSAPFLRKLQRYCRLSTDDKRILERAASERQRTIGPRHDLVSEGDEPKFTYIIHSGWACRYKLLPDGRRQIISFVLPGDLCDLDAYILRRADNSIAAITPVQYSEIDRCFFSTVERHHQRILYALRWNALVTVAMQREWTVNLGQRDAFERLAHLFCELYLRLDSVGLVHAGTVDFPIVQTDLADAAGLSPVHVNRVLQELRAQELIVLNDRRLTLPDLSSLMKVSMFNPNYLHLDHEGRQFDAND